MAEPLPPELVDADTRLHALHTAIRFSAHLNPLNIAEARAAFFAGAAVPPFAYAPATWADDARAALASLRVPTAHPLGVEMAAAAAETAALVDALDRRDADSFLHLARLCDWLPDDVEEPIPATPPSGPISGELAADRMHATLRDALRRRGLVEWELVWDPVMASRILVDAARHAIRINPAARFRETDRAGLVAHEIDVHAIRGANGASQPLQLFTTGLARSLLTEEGLAIVAEEHVRALSPGFFARQALVMRAVRLAADLGFRDLYAALLPAAGPAGAWQIALRVKRGLGAPGLPGVYAKDTVYLRGYRRVRTWLAAGGDVARLYVGKVGVHHPVDAWLAAGWIRATPVPGMRARAA
jgi:hypothetical protein